MRRASWEARKSRACAPPHRNHVLHAREVLVRVRLDTPGEGAPGPDGDHARAAKMGQTRPDRRLSAGDELGEQPLALGPRTESRVGVDVAGALEGHQPTAPRRGEGGGAL